MKLQNVKRLNLKVGAARKCGVLELLGVVLLRACFVWLPPNSAGEGLKRIQLQPKHILYSQACACAA